MVRVKGLEPSHLSIPEPKSGASTNSATPAQVCRAFPVFSYLVKYWKMGK